MADGYVRRTAITRLSVDGEQRELLEETISGWKRGCQIATDLAWGRCNIKSDVQPLAYDSVREYTDLGSQHARANPPPPRVREGTRRGATVVSADGRQSARPEVWNGDAKERIYRLPRRVRGRVHGQAPPSKRRRRLGWGS